MLRDIDLTVRPGEVLGISGPSASGKTTLLHLIAGLEDPDQGSVRLSGVTLTDDDVLIVQDRRNLMLAGQDAVLDRENNVAANIATALPWDKKRRRVGAHRVAMVLDLLELDTALADSRPAQLSAGERQRVALARAIVGFGLGGPEAAVLLDEPLSAVEVGTRIRLLQAVLADVGRQPIPVVLVSHDAGRDRGRGGSSGGPGRGPAPPGLSPADGRRGRWTGGGAEAVVGDARVGGPGRAVLLLREVLEVPAAEVADVLGITTVASEQRLAARPGSAGRARGSTPDATARTGG